MGELAAIYPALILSTFTVGLPIICAESGRWPSDSRDDVGPFPQQATRLQQRPNAVDNAVDHLEVRRYGCSLAGSLRSQHVGHRLKAIMVGARASRRPGQGYQFSTTGQSRVDLGTSNGAYVNRLVGRLGTPTEQPGMFNSSVKAFVRPGDGRCHQLHLGPGQSAPRHCRIAQQPAGEIEGSCHLVHGRYRGRYLHQCS